MRCPANSQGFFSTPARLKWLNYKQLNYKPNDWITGQTTEIQVKRLNCNSNDWIAIQVTELQLAKQQTTSHCSPSPLVTTTVLNLSANKFLELGLFHASKGDQGKRLNYKLLNYKPNNWITGQTTELQVKPLNYKPLNCKWLNYKKDWITDDWLVKHGIPILIGLAGDGSRHWTLNFIGGWSLYIWIGWRGVLKSAKCPQLALVGRDDVKK
jgi:hypothetical protein